MSTEYPEQSTGFLGFLGFLVVGGTVGFAGYMLTRAGTISGVVEAVWADANLVALTLLVVLFGVALALFYEGR